MSSRARISRRSRAVSVSMYPSRAGPVSISQPHAVSIVFFVVLLPYRRTHLIVHLRPNSLFMILRPNSLFSAHATLQPADGHRGGREATGAVPVCEAALLGAARSLSLSPSPSLSLHWFSFTLIVVAIYCSNKSTMYSTSTEYM